MTFLKNIFVPLIYVFFSKFLDFLPSFCYPLPLIFIFFFPIFQSSFLFFFRIWPRPFFTFLFYYSPPPLSFFFSLSYSHSSFTSLLHTKQRGSTLFPRPFHHPLFYERRERLIVRNILSLYLFLLYIRWLLPFQILFWWRLFGRGGCLDAPLTKSIRYIFYRCRFFVFRKDTKNQA